jgi:hypothetical protein
LILMTQKCSSINRFTHFTYWTFRKCLILLSSTGNVLFITFVPSHTACR